MEVTAVAGDSAVAKLVRLVEEAQAARSSSERAVETFAKHYTPLVVLVAFLIATTPYVFAGATGPGYVYIGVRAAGGGVPLRARALHAGGERVRADKAAQARHARQGQRAPGEARASCA